MTKPQSGNILKNSGETEQKTQGEIWDENGKQIPVDFVNTGNNHHVAIYRKPVLDKKGQVTFDEDGNLMYELDEVVVPFFEAVTRANLGLPTAISYGSYGERGASIATTTKNSKIPTDSFAEKLDLKFFFRFLNTLRS